MFNMLFYRSVMVPNSFVVFKMVSTRIYIFAARWRLVQNSNRYLRVFHRRDFCMLFMMSISTDLHSKTFCCSLFVLRLLLAYTYVDGTITALNIIWLWM